MKWMKTLCASVASLMICGLVIAQDPPATQPADAAKNDPARTPDARPPANRTTGARWGFAPYNKLTTLTEEQKQKIIEIRRQFLADRKALEQKQEEDIMAILTDENKAELEKIDVDAKAAAKERRQATKDKKESGDDDEKDK